MSGLSPTTTAFGSLLWLACSLLFGWSYLSIPAGVPISLFRKSLRVITGIVAGVGVLGGAVYALAFLVVLIVMTIIQLVR